MIFINLFFLFTHACRCVFFWSYIIQNITMLGWSEKVRIFWIYFFYNIREWSDSSLRMSDQKIVGTIARDFFRTKRIYT